MCSYSNVIKYCLLIFKIILPVFLLLIGFAKLIFSGNKKKSLKKLIIYLVIALIIFGLSFIVEYVLKNEYECIKCSMEDSCEVIDIPIDTPTPTPANTPDKKDDDVVEKPVEPVVEKNKIEVIDGITYVDGYMIVNKTYSLPADYVPAGGANYERCNECLSSETKAAFNEMQADAQAAGLNLYISSGYRSYDYQKRIYNNYVSRDGKAEADRYSARPGHSEHQTGLAFDLNTIDDSFGYTAEGKWVEQNCYKYGLILRYPKGTEDKTGYLYESWHLRYVGKDLALKLYNNGNWITMEEYFNLTSVYE